MTDPVLHPGRATGARLGAILVASFLVKTHLASLVAEIPLVWDERKYHDAAATLAAAGLDPRAFPGTFLTPGYPYFIAAVMALAGPHPLWVRLAQVVVSTLTVAMVFLLARAVAGERAALRAAAFFAFLPELVGMTHLLWSETLLLLVMSGALLATVAAHQRGASSLALASGLLWGVATLVKPAYVYYAPLAALLLGARRDGRPARRPAMGVLFLAGFLGALAPWLARNHAITGRPFALTTNGWINLWVGNKDRGTPAHSIYRSIEGEEAREAHARREALAWISGKGSWWLPIKVHRNVPGLLGVANFNIRHIWLEAYGPVGIGAARLVIVLSVLGYVLLMVAGILGYAGGPRSAFWWHATLFVGPAVGFHVLMESLTRYRIPFLVFAVVFAGQATTLTLTEVRRTLRRPLALALLVILGYAIAFGPDNALVADVWNGRSASDRSGHGLGTGSGTGAPSGSSDGAQAPTARTPAPAAPPAPSPGR